MSAAYLELVGAVTRGDTEYLKMWLEKNGDPNWQSPGHLATKPLLIVACEAEADFTTIRNMVSLLRKAGAKIDAVDSKNRTVLLQAVSKVVPDVELVASLLAHGANPNHQDSDGDTPLLLLTEEGEINLDCVKLLFAHGADPDLANKKGVSLRSRFNGLAEGNDSDEVAEVVTLIRAYDLGQKPASKHQRKTPNL